MFPMMPCIIMLCTYKCVMSSYMNYGELLYQTEPFIFEGLDTHVTVVIS